jgi:hypothetical protein
MLERGEREPRLSTVVALAQALGVRTQTLIAGVDDAAPRTRQQKPGAGPQRR